MLESLGEATPEDLLGNWRDGRIKLFLTQRLLVLRRQNPELFREGTYRPLGLTGEFADCCIAFARELEGKSIVVVAPRLSSRIGFPPIGEAWRDTTVQLPEGFDVGRDLFTGETTSGSATFPLRGALARLPFAVWRNTGFQPVS
jgi:(1->4)-alpha-D-glucan 1-alpha-D-glucosylmutase